MPVAKLSREFYERFGDKVTDELVNCLNAIEVSYRAELRDLFEAQFGRFEEKLAHHIAENRALIEHHVAEIKALLAHGLAENRALLEHGLAETRGELRTEFRTDVAQLRVEIHAVKAELLKWTFVFWVPVVLALIGLYVKA